MRPARRSACCMGMFFTYVGIGMVWSILTVYATSLGASAATAGATISAFGASRLFVSVPAGMISERLGRVRVMVVGLLLVAAASFIALAVHSMATLLACLMLQGVGSACYGTAALSAVTDRGTPLTRVRDMAAYQTATQIGLSLGPGLGGLRPRRSGAWRTFRLPGRDGADRLSRGDAHSRRQHHQSREARRLPAPAASSC